jgi:Na+-transporting NADH:ubiquinone oxidoreductase subunit NqrC
MSALQQTSYQRPQLNRTSKARSTRNLTAEDGLIRLVQTARTSTHPMFAMAKIVIIGILLIAGLSLLLNILTSQGVYDLASLKNEKKELTITSQILSEQVDSLSSDQNLSSAAAQLGMVANSNPVFLRVEDQKIFGHPKAAIADSTSFIRAALVPNAAQVRHTNVNALIAQAASAKAAKAQADALAQAAAAAKSVSSDSSDLQASKAGAKTDPATKNVAGKKSGGAKVPLNTGGIPASPTN